MDLERIYNSPELVKDPSLALAHFDLVSIRMFDAMQPVEYRAEDFRKHFVEVVGQFPGGKTRFTDLEVNADPRLAFATFIQHFSGKSPDGKPYEMTLRVTDGLRKTGNRWLIVHEHASLALDAATFMSVVTAKSGPRAGGDAP
jgi:ketosteroid isomerase-like protein